MIESKLSPIQKIRIVTATNVSLGSESLFAEKPPRTFFPQAYA
jgi:hypothetical protein